MTTAGSFRVPGRRPRLYPHLRGSEDDILSAVAAHVRADHGLNVIPDALVEQVRGALVTA